MEIPILFSYWRSSCAWRVRLALNLKGIKYNVKPVRFSQMGMGTVDVEDKFSAEYFNINPMRQVPALIIDGLTLIESLTIMNYLEESRPELPLLPKELAQRAQVRAICDIIISGIQPLQNRSVIASLGQEKGPEWARYFIKRGFTAVEKLLETSSGKYCFGDQITMADCCLVPQVHNSTSFFQVDMTPFPNIVRINAELQTHPAFIEGHPTKHLEYIEE